MLHREAASLPSLCPLTLCVKHHVATRPPPFIAPLHAADAFVQHVVKQNSSKFEGVVILYRRVN